MLDEQLTPFVGEGLGEAVAGGGGFGVHGYRSCYNGSLMTSLTIPNPSHARPASPRPTWEIAYLFPPQGMWAEGDYLMLSGNRLVELIDGKVEVLAMPTDFHQAIVAFI